MKVVLGIQSLRLLGGGMEVSVVTKDIPAGVPCKVIREITEEDKFDDVE